MIAQPFSRKGAKKDAKTQETGGFASSFAPLREIIFQ
jgi:hypothetical protein